MTSTRTSSAVHFATAEPLIRALSNALLFASTEMIFPMICAVKFEFDGTTLEVLATDRYQASIEIVRIKDDADNSAEPFHFLLSRNAATQVLAVLKKAKLSPITLHVGDVERSVRFETWDGSSEHNTVDATFPNVRPLIPELGSEVEMPKIGFNPHYLANLGKAMTAQAATPSKGARTDVVTIKVYGERKPSRVDFTDGPTVIIMPVKLAS